MLPLTNINILVSSTHQTSGTIGLDGACALVQQLLGLVGTGSGHHPQGCLMEIQPAKTTIKYAVISGN